MEISLIAAKILGSYMIVGGLFMLLRRRAIPHLVKDLFEHPALVYLAGAVVMYFPLMALIQGGNNWASGWRTVVTLLLWATLLKGLLTMLVPQVVEKLLHEKLLRASGLLGLIILVGGVALLFVS